MSRVGLANLFDRSGGSLTEAIRDEIEKVELKRPHHQVLIADVRKRWDAWDLRPEECDDCLYFDSFYNGFMAPYFGFVCKVFNFRRIAIFLIIQVKKYPHLN